MTTTDCVWEMANLNKKTCEVTLNRNEKINIDEIQKIERTFGYVVVKVPDKSVSSYSQLERMGYSFIETQFNIKYCSVLANSSSKKVKYFANKISLKVCDNRDSINNIIDRINQGLFTTDRIALDSNFGIEIANKRYSNWILNTIAQHGYELCDIFVGKLNVGFCYFSNNESDVHYILGGIYPEYQGKGFGIVEQLVSCIYMENHGLQNVVTSISSNNIDVLKGYLECGFEITAINNVFVKVL